MFKVSNFTSMYTALVLAISVSYAMDKPPRDNGLWQRAKNWCRTITGTIGSIETDPVKKLDSLVCDYLRNNYERRSNENTITAIISLIKQHPDLMNREMRPGQSLLMFIAAPMIGTADEFRLLEQSIFNSNINLHINMKNGTGRTALMVASHHGDITMIRDLLQHGADVDAQDDTGNTALMDVLLSGRIRDNVQRSEAVRLLLEAGANPTIKNREGKTAFDVATQFNDNQSLALLNQNKKKKIK